MNQVYFYFFDGIMNQVYLKENIRNAIILNILKKIKEISHHY